MSGAQSFPTTAAELSESWLTAVLTSAGVLRDGAVQRLQVAPVAEQGAAGVVVRLTIDYSGPQEDAPGSLVVKFATPHAPIRAVMHRFGFYKSEIEFYRQLGGDAGIPTPRCYYAEIDTTTGCFVLVLEDMVPARVGDPLTPRLDDVEMAVDHVARFHARWWNHERLRTLGWLVYPEGPAFEARIGGLGQSFAASLATVRERLGGRFPEVLAEAGERMAAHWGPYVASRLAEAPTLVHRDFHSQQMFFPSEHGGRFAVFDWQTISIGRGVEDLSRLASMALTTSQRSAHQDTLLERYHRALCANGVGGYSLARCRDEFRLGLTASFVTNVVAGATLDPSVFAAREQAAGVTLAYAIFDRMAAAFEANDVLALLPSR